MDEIYVINVRRASEERYKQEEEELRERKKDREKETEFLSIVIFFFL
jgi:hypothetical protein